MSEKQLYWIGKGTFGVGKNAVKYNKPMPKIDPKRLKALIKEGSVGELKTTVAVDSDEVISDLKEQLKDAKGDAADALKSDLDVANKFIANLEKALKNPKLTIDTIKSGLEEHNKTLEDKKAAEANK